MCAKTRRDDDEVYPHPHYYAAPTAERSQYYYDDEEADELGYGSIDFHHSFIGRKSSISTENNDQMTLLADNFIPSQYDVIVGTGREARNHVGNFNFQEHIIKKHIGEYLEQSKLEKGRTISQIIEEAKSKSPTGTPFVKKLGDGKWYAVGYNQAREKVSQSVRNELHDKYRSSVEAKKHRRIKICKEIDASVYNMMQRRGSFISDRINKLCSEMKNCGKQVSDNEVEKIFTEANIDILEGLKQHTKSILQQRQERSNEQENKLTYNI